MNKLLIKPQTEVNLDSILPLFPAIQKLTRHSTSKRMIIAAASFRGENEPFMWSRDVKMTLLSLQNRCDNEGLVLKIKDEYKDQYPGSVEVVLGGYNTKQVAYLSPISNPPVIVAEIEEVPSAPLSGPNLFQRPKFELNLKGKHEDQENSLK